MMYRQGDVMIEAIDIIPAKVKRVARDNGRVVLAYGEVTGHAHAFRSDRVKMFRHDDTGDGVFLAVLGDSPADLEHEEHSIISIPPGSYRVTRQREYSPESIRQVAD